MRHRSLALSPRIAAMLLACACLRGADSPPASAPPPPAGSPADSLPPHIRRATSFGERADWSHDGKKILFVEKTFGDVYELDVAGGAIRPVTHHFRHNGFTRALYLSNGDVLLSGPASLDPLRPGDARTQCFLSVLDKSFTKPPAPLGAKCSEGPAVSRTRAHIAWARNAAQYPDLLPRGTSQILEADIVYENGVPRLANERVALDSRDLPFRCSLEPQNFVQPSETKLIFSAYDYQGTEVCLLDLAGKQVANLTNAPGQYDEPEGIFPDGLFTLVECDSQNKQGSNHVDLWKLRLDGGGYAARLTNFSDYPGYKASNPVVSDDGKFIAFQLAKSVDAAGVGHGIFIFDLGEAPASASPAAAAP